MGMWKWHGEEDGQQATRSWGMARTRLPVIPSLFEHLLPEIPRRGKATGHSAKEGKPG
jgi:hypothetical protein